MKKYLSGFIAGVLTMIIMLGSISVFAGDGTQSIHVVLNKINIAVNGKIAAKTGDNYTLDSGKSVPFSILYDGTTYLPLRKVSELVGKDIGWDGQTSTADIKDKIEIENNSVVEATIHNVGNYLKTNGFIDGSSSIMLADLIGAKNGIKYKTSKGDIEIYEYDIQSESYKTIVNTGSIELDGIGIVVQVSAVNGKFVIFCSYHSEAAKVIECFKSFK